MENKNVKELQEIAKEQKIKYYYKLRREDLLAALTHIETATSVPHIETATVANPDTRVGIVQRPIPTPRPVVQRSILDEPIPSSASSPVLALEPKRPVPAPRPVAGSARLTLTLTTAVRSVASYVSNTFKKLLEWIDPYVPEPIKKKVSNARDGVEKRIWSLKSIVFGKPSIKFQLTDHALKYVTQQFSDQAEENQQDASVFLDVARDGAMKIFRENRNKKVNLVLTCELSRLSIVTGEETTRTVPFLSKYGIVLEATDLGELYNTVKEEILENMVKYSSGGSNWKVSNILKIDINIINYNPLSASYWIELNEFLRSKKAIINIQNDENECFKWCVTMALNMKNKNNERIDKKLVEKSKEFNWEGIEFPIKLNQIEKFVNNNADISVSVFGFENEKPYPLKKLKYFGRKHHIDLLLISNKMTNHYCLIIDFSRLMSSSTSAHQHKTYYYETVCKDTTLKKRFQSIGLIATSTVVFELNFLKKIHP